MPLWLTERPSKSAPSRPESRENSWSDQDVVYVGLSFAIIVLVSFARRGATPVDKAQGPCPLVRQDDVVFAEESVTRRRMVETISVMSSVRQPTRSSAVGCELHGECGDELLNASRVHVELRQRAAEDADAPAVLSLSTLRRAIHRDPTRGERAAPKSGEAARRTHDAFVRRFIHRPRRDQGRPTLLNSALRSPLRPCSEQVLGHALAGRGLMTPHPLPRPRTAHMLLVEAHTTGAGPQG
ncbi:hypothetical protein [Streptomyces sp. NPDC087300]|uniref:hypothetical protein n=1 Tax=Streptomyces sp. NPDC087300 TaxID=3365780 RepID=UPI0037FC3BF9